LGGLTANKAYTAAAEKLLKLFHQTLTDSTSSVPMMVMAFDFLERGKQQIVLAGDRSTDDFKALLHSVQSRFLPYALIIHADGGESQQHLSQHNEALASMKVVNGQPAAYVCENFTCQAPVTTAEALTKLLD